MCCASRPTPCSKATVSWSSTRDTWWRGRSRPACATGSTPKSRRGSARAIPSSCRSTAPRSRKECAPSSATKRARGKTARPVRQARRDRAADGPRRDPAGGAPRAGREGPAGGRTDRPRRAPSRSALGRPAPARGDRPRHGHGTVDPSGRRADREPRPRLRPRDHRADREDEPRGVDARGRHTRPGNRREGAAHPEARGRAHLLGREGGMNALDLLRFAWGALKGHRLRTALTLLGMAIGVGAVILLTALGEGARGYVTNEFMALGSNLLIVLPGKTERSEEHTS